MSDTDRPRTALWQRALTWLVTAVCFLYLYTRIDRQAAAQGQDAIPYLLSVFGSVSWTRWLALMVPYSFFFFLIDSLVVWRVINWFNAPVRYSNILPIRATAYIISILNEQVGKGAMALYLNRRDGVPGWQVGSSMLFIMFCEFYYLLFWALVGVSLRWEGVPDIFHLIPLVAVGAGLFFVAWVLYFRGAIAPGVGLRDRQILHAFRQASPWNYLGVLILRSPALLAAVVVYTLALRLFGVDASFVTMLGYLPVIFFGAAMPVAFRAVAITMWAVVGQQISGENVSAQMTAFGFVQHNFFILFNGFIGLLFLRRANRELFGRDAAGVGDAQPVQDG